MQLTFLIILVTCFSLFAKTKCKKNLILSTAPDTLEIRYTCYQNGNLKESIHYKNSKYDGLYEVWYANGKKHYEVNYTQDSLNGFARDWDSIGQLISENYYIKDHHVGDYKDYYSWNKPKELTHYDSLGRKQGVSLRWREDGTLKDSMVYKDGRGIEAREYFDNGTVRLHEWSSAPFITDSAVYYAPDGKNKSIVANGNGEVLMFSENRKQIFGMKIENGKTLWTRPIEDAIKK